MEELIHGSNLEDSGVLHRLVSEELQSRGVYDKLGTPKERRKNLVPFSTPSSNHTGYSGGSGRIFGRRLNELSKLLVSLIENQDIEVLIPKLVVSACKYIEEHVHVEGIYRMSGSAARQKVMRKDLDSFDIDFREMDPPPSVLDVASLLKQFLRELPLPIIPHRIHQLLTASFSSPETLKLDNVNLCLLSLPSEHLACLSYLLRHLFKVSQHASQNKMTVTNLAIVLTPNLLPIQDAHSISSSNNVSTKLDKKIVELNNHKLKVHTSILAFLITNHNSIGFVGPPILEKYQAMTYCTSLSEDNLDDDLNGRSKRRNKKKHIRKRSGSLSRALSVVGKSIQKAIGRNPTTPGSSSKMNPSSIHSTPLPLFGGTPDYPSPRENNAKRKATGDHELSPTNKQQKRTFESTFTPKMRTRTFSVKRFKRKKSEGKMKPMSKETLLIHVKNSPVTVLNNAGTASATSSSPVVQRSIQSSSKDSLSCTSTITLTNENVGTIRVPHSPVKRENSVDSSSNDFESQYDEVKAHYEKIKQEVSRLESSESASVEGCIEIAERYEAACAAGSLAKESRETARQMARVRRKSSENGRKPRSPSQRRIGVLRRKSREREAKLSKELLKSPDSGLPSIPAYKAPLTPMYCSSKPVMKSKLQRGHPNATSVGLEKPSPIIPESAEVDGIPKPRIKMSFKGRDRPAAFSSEGSSGPLKANGSPLKAKSPKKLTHEDSIANLRSHISELIEKSFGSGDRTSSIDSMNDANYEEIGSSVEPLKDDVFVACRINLDKEGFKDKADVTELSNQIQNISFENKNVTPPSKSPMALDDMFASGTPVTRAQLRRQSECFEFTRPDDVETENTDVLRRQSSAFEFRSNFNEPTYENLSRNPTRGSLRRRNSSVKDLVLKLESEAKRRVGVPDLVNNKPSGVRLRSLDSTLTWNAKTYENVDTSRKQSKIVPEPITESADDTSMDSWVDASDFFKNVTEAEAPQCGRSSIVKMRNQIKGRVQDSVTKFSQPGSTPHRHPGSRRLSARMGTAVSTPGVRPIPSVTPSHTPMRGKKQTLTGIRTSASSGKRLSTYANPTLSSINKVKDKSPVLEQASGREGMKNMKRSPMMVVPTAPQKSRRSPRENTYQNINVERKSSLSRDLKKHSVQRSTSGSKDRRTKVKRNRSNAEKEKSKRKEERRYLTIGYPGEVRSPLKERQNIPTNVRRSNSDQTPNRAYKPGEIITRSKLRNETAFVARKHSLKSDLLMSPQLAKCDVSTPNVVKRTVSERATPRRTPVVNGNSLRVKNVELRNLRISSDSPRRSPRLSNNC